MKKIRNLIIILVISIIVLITIIFIYNLYFKKEIQNNTQRQEEGGNEEYVPDQNITLVDGADIYYMVTRNVNTYISCIEQANGIIDEVKYDKQEVKDDGIRRVLEVLDSEYIDEFGINKDNISEKLKGYTEYDLDIRKIYKTERNNNMFIYIVYALLDNKDFNLIVKVDNENGAFSIYPQEYMEKYNYSQDIVPEKVTINDKSVSKNSSNNIRYAKITDDYIASDYFNQYKKRMIGDPEYAYSLLNEEYKNARFGSVDEFKKYVNSNKEEIEGLEVQQYLKNTYKDYTQYVCKDQYENIYIFDAKSIMDYEVELDDYTLSTEEIDEQYKNASDAVKVVNNVNKWIKMINSRNYKAAFNVLDETFRTTNFNNDVDTFEKYMKYYFAGHYKVQYGELTEEAGVYIQEIDMEDVSGDDTMRIYEKIYMQLKEGNDFVMSFYVK